MPDVGPQRTSAQGDSSPSRGLEGLRPQTHLFTQHHLQYWRNCTSDSWVLASIHTSYTLQVHSGPPPFRRITVTSVNDPLQQKVNKPDYARTLIVISMESHLGQKCVVLL
ncbi:UNVERIFIED_CONTAM: hypothetical protein FKN15_059908 [Acipenser sinensis]